MADVAEAYMEHGRASVAAGMEATGALLESLAERTSMTWASSALSMVATPLLSAAAKDNEGRRITLNLTTPDGSRRASFGIGMRAHLTKLMPRFAAMLPAAEGGSARTAESLRFESSGRTLQVRPCPLVGCSRVGL